MLNTKLRMNFLELTELLGVGPENQTFKVGGKDVVFIFDAPHMMTVTRNNLMKHSLKIDGGGQTSWKHIKTLFVKESESGEQNTKLTESHINPDRQFKRTLPALAIDVLSNTVASEIEAYVESGKMPAEALATAECITMFDRLFDMLNARYEVSMNEFANAYKATKRQKQYLEKVMRFLETLKVFDNKGKEKTSEVKFISAWLTTIRGIMKLWEIIKDKDYDFLLTANTHSEPLDSFINQCRYKLIFIEAPTPRELCRRYLEVFIGFYFLFKSPQSFMNMRKYAELIYKRIPAVRHNLGNTSDTTQQRISLEEFTALVMEDLLHHWL
ncbi:unnamed protein product [Callosobruchus maculatus]|nr:unnamed protein product [Callosobruchus maculatus]